MVRKVIKAMPEFLKSPELQKVNSEWLRPLRSTVGGINYASKNEEPLLQLADACAFALRRDLAGFPKTERF